MNIFSLEFLDTTSDKINISGGNRLSSDQVFLFPSRLGENPEFYNNSNNFDSDSDMDFDSGLSASASSSSSSLVTPPEN